MELSLDKKIAYEAKNPINSIKIKSQESLDSTPESGIFFEKREFYSELKQKFVSDEEYKNSFYLYKTLKMRNISDMNDLYNAQDVTLLYEIIENYFQLMYVKYGFNPRKCNSACTVSDCIERDLSKVIIALLASNKVVEVFEKTLSGGFSCVNTRLSFDTELRSLNANNMSVDGDENLYKDYDYKICYRLKLDSDNWYESKRVISKTLKLD